MTSTRFDTYYLDLDNIIENNDNINNNQYVPLLCLASGILMFKYSRMFFSQNKSLIKPLECTYKYLFRYDKDYNDINLDEDDSNDEVISDSEEDDNVDNEEVISNSDNEDVDDNVENEETVSNNEDVDDNVENEETVSNNDNEDVDNNVENEETVSNSEDNVKEAYNSLFEDKEFKVFLLNLIKDKEKEIDNTENLNKYKEFITNLEKDTLEYVYVEKHD